MINVLADTSGATREMESFGTKAKGWGKATAIAAGGAVLALGASQMGDWIAEAEESAVVGARTTNVIKTMGNAANISADQVGELAGAISNKTGIDDEAIQAGQNMLLTFKNVSNAAGEGNAIFDRTTQVMTDMSAATGKDMSGSAVMLGKALNDPIKGLSALSRVGVQFDRDQQQAIKSMVASGDVMAAQKMILGELEKQFGGAAEAMTTPAQKAKTNWANFQETMGTAVLPTLNQVLGVGNKILGWMNAHPAATKVAVFAVGGLAVALGALSLATTIQSGSAAVAAISTSGFAASLGAATVAALPWIGLGLGIAAVAIVIIKNWDRLGPFFGRLWGSVRRSTGEAVDWIGGKVRGLVEAVTSLPSRLGSIAGRVGDGLMRIVQGFAQAVAWLWNSTVARISLDVPDWVPGIGGKSWSVSRLDVPALGATTAAAPGSPDYSARRDGDVVVQIDGREVARAANRANSRGGR